MHILVAYDGTHGAREAARFVEQLATPMRARITLLAVSPRRQRSVELRQDLEDLADRMRAHGLQVHVRMVTGQTVPAILGALATGDHDLVALGSHGDNVLSRLLGSTSRQIIRRSTVPVLVVDRDPGALRRILVCTSAEAPHGTAALDLPVRISAATDAAVEILHVMSQIPPTADIDIDDVGLQRTARWHRDHDTTEGQHLTRIVELFTARGVEADAKIRHGLVVDEIIDEARTQPADLVVLGAHGRPGVLPLLLEDITEHVTDQLARPILIVKEPSPRHDPA